MLDINFIRENSEKVKKASKDKGIDVDIDELLKTDKERKDLIGKVDELRAERNEAAKNKDIEKGKNIKETLRGLEKELREAEERFDHLMLYIPNIPSGETPIGPNTANKEIKKWGKVPKFDFIAKDHIELGKLLDIIDLEAGVKTSGFRGYFLKNEGAKLHWAVLNCAFKKIMDAGFTPMVPPTLVHEKVLIGSGHFPFGKENIYQIKDTEPPAFLAGTSEPSLLSYFMDKQIPEEELPIKVCALTQCYRSEVGDYGKDTKGLFRVHEFAKVEQVIICKNDLDESKKHFEEMQKISENLLEELKLPYHVVITSTGDQGVGKYQMNDIETWMPSRNSYGETHSNSNLTDWQARRLNLKFRGKDGKLAYCHTLNNTVIASPRILIAILENFQQKDGSVKIPEVLIPYTGFSEIRPK